jgi:hypothetical protein
MIEEHPVYTERDEKGEESIIFHTAKMEEGRLYEIVYQGKPIALRKNGKYVDFMEFVPDNKFLYFITEIYALLRRYTKRKSKQRPLKI